MQPCSWVRVGKLRVRCSQCREGAIIVDRDPASWSDVLVPGQVNTINFFTLSVLWFVNKYKEVFIKEKRKDFQT